MTRPRLSIGRLMGLVLGAAVAFGALRDGSDLTASALFSGLLLASGLAILAAIHRRGPSRAFWSGFAAFGLAYALLAFAPLDAASRPRPRLLTSRALDALYPLLHPEGERTIRIWSAPGGMSAGTTRTVQFAIDSSGSLIASSNPGGARWTVRTSLGNALALVRTRDHFEDTGHALAGWTLALVGGCAGLWLHGAGRRDGRGEPRTG